MAANTRLLDLFFELQALDRVPRSGYALRGIADPESVSEHSFHIAFVAWALVQQEPGLDRGRVLELALVHDLAEVRTGDLPRTVERYLSRKAKAEAELAAARDILAPLGDRAVELFAEYQKRETPEARFVGVCDKLQLLVKAAVYEQWGAPNLAEFQRHLDDFDHGGFDSIQKVVADLRAHR